MRRFYTFLALLAMIPLGTKAQLTDCTGNVCNITIQMFDDYGDGWEDEDGDLFYVKVYQGTTLRGQATLSSGSSGTQTIQVCSDQAVRFVFSGYDDYEESSFTILNGGNAVVLSDANCWDYTNGQEIMTISNPCPSCIAPSNIAAAVDANGDMVLSWTGNGTNYYVLYAEAGTSIDNATSTTTTDTSLNLGSLDAGAYTAWIYNDCGDGDLSDTVVYNFSVAGEAISTFPYTTGFETGDDAGWDFTNGYNTWMIGSTAHATGSKAMYISNGSGDNNNYSSNHVSISYATRQFVVDDEADYELSYDWKANGEENYDYGRAWIAPASATFTANQFPNGSTNTYNYRNTTPTGWIDVSDGKLNQSSSWTTKSKTVHLAAGTYQMVFLWCNDDDATYNPALAIDNILLQPLSCPQPVSLAVADMDTASISITWSAGGDETMWEVSIDGVAETVYDTAYTFTDLNAMTTYNIAVRAICGAGDTSMATTLSVRTPCALLTDSLLPFTEDFNSWSTGSSASIDPCWNRFNTYSTSYNYPYASTNQRRGGTGNALYFYSSATTYNCIVLPAVEDLNGKMLSFWTYMATPGSCAFQVGTMTDPSDINTFTTIYTTPTGLAASTWVEHEVLVPAGVTAHYLAIRNSNTSSYTSYIDDITLMVAPSCFHPASVSVSDIASTSADITVNDPTEAGHYRYYLSRNDTIVDSNDFYNDTYTLNTLTEATAYTVQVVTVCDDGTVTQAVSVSFVTACEFLTPSDLPLVEDFESYNSNFVFDVPCWTRLNFYSSYPNYPVISTSYAYGGSGKSLRFYPGYTYQPQFLALPPVDDLSGLMLSFQYQASASVRIDIGYMSNPSDSTTFVALSRVNGNGLGNTNWAPVEYVFGSLPANVHNAAIRVGVNSSYGYSAYIDDLTLMVAPSCLHPDGVSVDNITTSSADITVIDSTELYSYRYFLLQGSTVVDSGDFSSSTYTLTSLTEATSYTLQVVGVCSDGTITASVSANFMTPCTMLTAADLPIVEGFESYSSGFVFNVPCWTRRNYYTTSPNYPVITNSYAYTGNNSLRFYPGYSYQPQFIALPAVDDLNGLMLSFQYQGSTYVRMDIGYMANPNDSSSFVSLGRVNCIGIDNNNWSLAEQIFNNIPDSIHYAAIRVGVNSSYGYSSYIDDITLNVAPGCSRPTAVSVTGITAVDATINISDPSEVGSYHIVILNGNDTVVNEIISDTSYTIDTLTPATTYTVAVSTICIDGSETAATTTSFATTCLAISTFPWNESFENASSVLCWTTLRYDGSTNTEWNRSSSYASDGGYSMRSGYNASTNANSWLITPPIEVPADADGLTMSFDLMPVAYSTAPGTIVVRLSPTGGFDTASFTVTALTETSTLASSSASFVTRSLSLDAYAGQTITVAFVHNSYNDDGAYVDNINIRVTNTPVVAISGSTTAFTSDTNYYVATLAQGSSAGIGYSWTSSLGTVIGSADTVGVVYSAAGTDTLIATVTNSYGSDSDTMIVTVVACDAITTFPWLVDFNSDADIACWLNLNLDNLASDDWEVESGIAHTNYNESSAANDWLITPAISIPSDADGLSLCWIDLGDSYQSYDAHLTVLVSTSGVATSAFTDTLLSAALPETWTRRSFPLDEYAGMNIRVAFIHDSYNDNGCGIDSVNVRYTLAPVVAVSPSRATVDLGDTLDFQASLTEGVSTGIVYTWSSILGTVLGSGDNVSIVYNTEGTDTVTVTATNSHGTATATAVVIIRNCTGISTLPYVENFNSTPGANYDANGELPSCWDAQSNASSQPLPHVSASGSYHFSPDNSNSLVMTCGDAGDGWATDAYAILPTFTAPLSGLSMSFWMATEYISGYGTLYVGYMDASDNFTAIDTIPASSTTYNSNGGINDTVSFASVPAGNYRIAFHWHHASSYYSVCIDNVTVTGNGNTPTYYTVSATSANATMGTASVTPSGSVEEGTSVTATATANDGFQFVNWTVGGNVVSTANPYTFSVTANTTLVANFDTLLVPCDAPTAVTVSNVGLTSATISWTAAEGQDNFEVHVTGTGYDQTFSTSATTYTVTGLATAVEYTVTVRAICSVNNPSPWSAPATFTTNNCQPVTGVSVGNKTTNSVQVSWTAPAGVTNFELEYGASGFASGTGTRVETSTNSATLTGLTAGMAYDVYVRSVCGNGAYSPWSNATPFTTEDDQQGINDVNNANIALFPNPATTTVTLTGIDGQATVTIVDMNGRKNGEWKVENGNLTIDLTGYAQGAYFVRITGEQLNAIRKLIVK